jgi:Sulfotransferase family
MAAPLFLLAPPRSYTSLINAMLGQHPQAFGLPELCLFNVKRLKDLWVRDSDEMSDDSRARQGVLRAVAEIYAGEQSRAAVTMATHWAAAREDWSTADVYQELVAKIDPLVAVEKSPAYTIDIQRMLAIYDAFPNARFLHLVRHPIGMCKSVMSMNDGAFALYVNSLDFLEDRAIVDPQFAWHDLNINILNFLDIVPQEQQMRVRGEDIMSDPRRYLAEICRWLGLRDDEQAVDEMMHPERSPFACFGPITALFGNDPNFLRGPTFRPHEVKVPPLNKPLAWRDDGKGLYPRVIELAREFGYS